MGGHGPFRGLEAPLALRASLDGPHAFRKHGRRTLAEVTQRPRAVLLDLDDTILDDTGMVSSCWLDACHEHGAKIFAQVGCAQCHQYLGVGSGNLGAPDLSDVGKDNRGADYFANYVSNPAQYGNNVMPPYAGLGEENLQQLGAFRAGADEAHLAAQHVPELRDLVEPRPPPRCTR